MLEKKEERTGKRLIIGLSGGLIVLFGALATPFFLSIMDPGRRS